jgi:hypothetical protein
MEFVKLESTFIQDESLQLLSLTCLFCFAMLFLFLRSSIFNTFTSQKANIGVLERYSNVHVLQ